MTDEPLAAADVRSTRRFQLAAACGAILLLGMLGPWQRTTAGATQSGVAVAALLLLPAAALAGYALYEYWHAHEERRARVGWLLVAAALLVLLAEGGNADHARGDILVGWGAAVAGLGALGTLAAGIWVLRSPPLVP